MNRRHARAYALVLALAVPLATAAGQTSPHGPPLLIANVNIVPMDTERIEVDQTVILRGGLD